MRKIFWSNTEEVNGGWKNLLSNNLHGLCSWSKFVEQSIFADLIVYLHNASLQGIKKQCDFGGLFGKKMHLMKREIRLVAICRIKLITSNNYSPTKKSLFCLLKLLTTDCKSKGNCGTSPAGWDKDLTLSELIWFVLISRGLSVGDTYRK